MSDEVVAGQEPVREQKPQFDVGFFQRGRLVLKINEEMGNQLCDVLEAALAAGLTLPRAVYSMGEQLAHRIEPGSWFGVEKKEAA